MEIENKVVVAATPAEVWALLLDAQAMAGCVPGMQSIEVISSAEYIGVIKVKISFITAKFRLHTRIVEQREPEYMRIEGTGEDASVASSLKQHSEIFIAALPDGKTELRMRVTVDVIGRLGTFGLSVMKTKADRMWDEFCRNFAARLGGDGAAEKAVAAADTPAVLETPTLTPTPTAAPAEAGASAASVAPPAPSAGATAAAPASGSAPTNGEAPLATIDGLPVDRNNARGWWSRLVGARSVSGKTIHIELRRGDTQLAVDWPAEAAADCAAWLREALR